MKTKLINPKNGDPYFGLLNNMIEINIQDAFLKTKMGKKRSSILKKFLLKQFMFTGIINKDFICGIAIADLQYASKGFFYAYDIKKDIMIEESELIFLQSTIDPKTENQTGRFKNKNIEILFDNEILSASSTKLKIQAKLFNDATLPLRLVSKTSYNGWFFTKKQTCIPCDLTLNINEKEFIFDKDSTLAITDRSLGFPGREIWWNWAATASILENKKEFGMNLSWGINQTGETENFISIENKKIKIQQASFEKNDNNTWFIKTNDNILNLKFTPMTKKTEKENFMISAANFTQEIGRFEGTAFVDGKIIDIDCLGWLEDHYVKW